MSIKLVIASKRKVEIVMIIEQNRGNVLLIIYYKDHPDARQIEVEKVHYLIFELFARSLTNRCHVSSLMPGKGVKLWKWVLTHVSNTNLYFYTNCRLRIMMI